ncbi:MAG: hypothetical protein KQJ78_17410 [Deltaproteobacteria bacterium]|nr:hypothetical protein [Deltaproteobacteria bacterium]
MAAGYLECPFCGAEAPDGPVRPGVARCFACRREFPLNWKSDLAAAEELLRTSNQGNFQTGRLLRTGVRETLVCPPCGESCEALTDSQFTAPREGPSCGGGFAQGPPPSAWSGATGEWWC